MVETYILKYTKNEGFTIQFTERENEAPFVRLEFDFEDNPSIEHIETLAETLRTMSTHGKSGLYLDFNKIFLKNGEDQQDTIELPDGSTIPRLNTESVQAVVKKLMGLVPESYTNIHVEDADEENFAVLDAVLQNLPKHIKGLNLTYSQLDLLNQEQLLNALKESKLTKISFAGSLAEYSEERIEQLANNLPETLEEVNLFENGIDDEEAELFASKINEKININWREQPRSSSIPDIDFSKIGANLWNAVGAQLNQAQQVTTDYLRKKYQEYAGGTNSVATKEKFSLYTALDWIKHAANPSLGEYLDELNQGLLQTESTPSGLVTTSKKDELSTVTRKEDLDTSPGNDDLSIVARKEKVDISPKNDDLSIVTRKEEVDTSPRNDDLIIANREEEVDAAHRNENLSTPQENLESTVSSSLLFGFFQAMKHASIVFAAVVVGGLVGAGVGLAVSAIATPGAGIAAGISVGVAVTALALPTMYRFFSPSKKENDRQEDENLHNNCFAH